MDDTGITESTFFGKDENLATEMNIIPDDPNNPKLLQLTPSTMHGFDQETNRIHINYIWGSVDLQYKNHECMDRVFNFLREISSDQISDFGRFVSPTG